MAHTMQQHRHESPIKAQAHTAFVHQTPAVEPVPARQRLREPVRGPLDCERVRVRIVGD